MKISPYIKRNNFCRAEDYRNKACDMANQSQGQPIERRAFIYLHEALTDVATGLLDLLNVTYAEDWPLSRYMKLLTETAPNLPEVCKGISPETYDTIYTETSTEKWSAVSAIVRELITYAAHFGGDQGGSKLIVRILHLLERYNDDEINDAFFIKSDKAGLEDFCDLPWEEKKRIVEILSCRARGKEKSRRLWYNGE